MEDTSTPEQDVADQTSPEAEVEIVAPRPVASVSAVKVDPETLVLRGRPKRAIRFRRGVIVGAAAFAICAILVTVAFALRPRSFRFAAVPDDASKPSSAPVEALSGLPRTYGDVPRLGAPLPGDLGRPFLAHQREAQADKPASSAEQRAEAARQQAASELKAARSSPVLVASTSSERRISEPAPATAAAEPASETKAVIALDPEHDPNAQRRKAEFVTAPGGQSDENSHAIRPSPSRRLLSAGSLISASLITGLRSDLPGLVVAQVTERVFDSPTGTILLVPQGARLIGSYDSVVAFGQRRALIVWQRIVFPDGSSLHLDNVPATDSGSYSGLADKVDFHTWTLLKGVVLSTLLGIGSNLTFSGQSDLVQAIRESTQQNFARAGDQLTSRNLQVQPTITIRPGTPVQLVVHRDLIFEAPAKEGVR